MRLRRHRQLRGGTVRLVLAAALLFVGRPAAAQDAPTIDISGRASTARTRGADGAPIFVYEFANFQCTHCARFALDVFPRIDSAFVQTGRVRWIFVNLPSPAHTNAWAAHEAAACAGAIGDRFWAMHDLLFETQAAWQDEPDARRIFIEHARKLDIAPVAFDACLDNDRVATMLLQDVIFAASSRVNGTPAFMVNNRHMVMGLKSFEEWTDILEKELKKTR